MSPKAEELLSYMIGLGHVGETIRVDPIWLAEDLRLVSGVRRSQLYLELIQCQCIRRVSANVYIVLRREPTKAMLTSTPNRKARSELEFLRDKNLELKEINQQLRDKIEKLTSGQEDITLRIELGLTETESKILLYLARRGAATWQILCDLCFHEDEVMNMNDPEGAVRSHIKRMRHKIRPRGIDLTTVYGYGFHMNDSERAKVKKLISERLALQ